MHLDKSGHFRSQGIAVPGHANSNNLHRLLEQLTFFGAKRLVVTGDLFHSRSNQQTERFLHWRKDISHIHIDLIRGNHDILPDILYKECDIITHGHMLTIGHFAFIHDREHIEDGDDHHYFSGHIHPSVRLRGAGRQTLAFPCFHITEKITTLPAFGNFTGSFSIEPARHDHVYAIAGTEVVRLK